MIRLGVVADDLTGSNDIGIMFAKGGYPAEIFTFSAGNSALAAQVGASQAAVVILNTNARLFAPAQAYEVSFLATQLLQQVGCRQFYTKTCSVFRGPVGAYFDAMLDALQQDFGLVVLGFPKNGRTTLQGIHYVRGQRLEETEFRNDPIHPMSRSNLVEILQNQTERKVSLLTADTIQRGPTYLRQEIASARKGCQYLILDVSDQSALATIAQAASDLPVFCGSSALAEELPQVWGEWKEPIQAKIHLPADQMPGVLVASGSLMPQSRAQLEALRAAGIPTIEFEPQGILNPATLPAAVDKTVTALSSQLMRGKDVCIHMPNDPLTVETIQLQGKKLGLSLSELGNRVSTILADVVGRVVEETGANRLVIAGGETSSAICLRLGITGFRVWKEIEPGLPSCLALGSQPAILVLKSGSFGSSEFLLKAIHHLRQETGSIHE